MTQDNFLNFTGRLRVKMPKEVKANLSDDELYDKAHQLQHNVSMLHIMMGLAYVIVEEQKDLFKTFNLFNHQIKFYHAAALKAINNAIDATEKEFSMKDIEAYGEDFDTFQNAMRWFFEERVETCGDHADRDIEYKARFAPHRPFYTTEENQAFFDGFKQGVFCERGEKTKLYFTDKNGGDKYYIHACDMSEWLAKYCNDNGIPKGLKIKKVTNGSNE